jgi:hypothetical protein
MIRAVLVMCLSFTSSGLGQGTVLFDTLIPGVVDARVFWMEDRPWERWTAQLFGGPIGTPESGFIPLYPIARFDPSGSGYVIPIKVTVPGIFPGETAAIQMRVIPNFTGGYAGSNIIPVTLGSESAAATLIGLQSIPAFFIPEPSSLVLLGMGALGLCVPRLRSRFKL